MFNVYYGDNMAVNFGDNWIGLDSKHKLLLFDKNPVWRLDIMWKIFGKIVFHQGLILSSVVALVGFWKWKN